MVQQRQADTMSNINVTIGKLNTTMDVILNESDNHKGRIDRLDSEVNKHDHRLVRLESDFINIHAAHEKNHK